MTINEVAGLLGYSIERAKALIAEGLQLPTSRVVAKMAFTEADGKIDVSDEQFNEFMEKFETEEPGRYPPADIRRTLLVESRHACGICRSLAPLQFHHMLDWARVQHHDASHMLCICGTCHTRCTNGEIDYKAQVMYKARLKEHESANQPLEEHQASKRQSDKETLLQIYAKLPRPLVNHYLDQAFNDRIHYNIPIEVAPAEDMVGSATFHLYDTELWRLLKEFFSEWVRVGTESEGLYHDHLNSGVATPLHWSNAPRDSPEREAKFKARIVQARHAFTLLNSYVRERFPDLDLRELDAGGERRYYEWVERIDREVAEITERLIKKQTDVEVEPTDERPLSVI